MGARKIEKYPIHILSFSQIKVDHSIQSRVETSKKYEREFSEAMLRGNTFPPVTVFFDGKHYWLADGFHRYGATKQASRVDPKLSGIRAEVRNGTRRDAIVHSAGSNIEFSIPRTDADKRRACELLFSDEEWGLRTNSEISRKTGVGNTSVRKFRIEWHTREQTAYPSTFIDASGNQRQSSLAKAKGKRRLYRSGNGSFSTSANGNRVYLGTNLAGAQAKAGEIHAETEAKATLLKTQESLESFFISRLVVPKRFDLRGPRHRGLRGFMAGDVVATWTQFDSSSDFPSSVGRVLLLRAEFASPASRAVVICFPEFGPSHLIEQAKKLGVEFLTPDELVASLKPEPEVDAADLTS